jgi:hypothetical protein
MTETTRRPKYVPSSKDLRFKQAATMDSGLTVEQEAYCRARALGMSQAEAHAAIECKLALSTVKTWERKKPAIVARIHELAKAATGNAILKTGLDREWVMTRLMQVAERCMQAEPVMVKGQPTGEYQFDSAGAIHALKLLGDTMQMFKPVEKKPEDDYANLSDDDIARIAAELAAQTGLAETLAGTETPAGPQQAGTIQALPAPS